MYPNPDVCRGQSRTEKMGRLWGHGAMIDQSDDRERARILYSKRARYAQRSTCGARNDGRGDGRRGAIISPSL